MDEQGIYFSPAIVVTSLPDAPICIVYRAEDRTHCNYMDIPVAELVIKQLQNAIDHFKNQEKD